MNTHTHPASFSEWAFFFAYLYFFILLSKHFGAKGLEMLPTLPWIFLRTTVLMLGIRGLGQACLVSLHAGSLPFTPSNLFLGKTGYLQDWVQTKPTG